jgi:predicted HTH transcriptional regulator
VEFLALLKEGEGETLEFKESFAEEKEILETICAFSNSKGGRILIGRRLWKGKRSDAREKHIAELSK